MVHPATVRAHAVRCAGNVMARRCRSEGPLRAARCAEW